MKRDLDLIRNILLKLEQSDQVRNGQSFLSDLGEESVIMAHLEMLEDAGFLEHKDWKPFPDGIIMRLGWRVTWAGHEFLDTIRDPEIWRKTKSGAEKLGSWSIKVLAEMAGGYVRAKAHELGLPM